ncbi:MAG: VOC family protein [Saprospiraceae bacterium]
MKTLLITIISLLAITSYGQTENKNLSKMKLNAGIIADNHSETKYFYTKYLGFGVTFENDFYLLMHTPNHQSELSFLKPNHPSQKPIFKSPYNGKGVYLTIEVDNVDGFYKSLKAKGVKIGIEIRDEPWGDRHFAIVDPNDVGIDIDRLMAVPYE